MKTLLQTTILFAVCCAVIACASTEEKDGEILKAQKQLNTNDGVDKQEAAIIAKATAINQSLSTRLVPNKPVDGGDRWIFDLDDVNPTTYEAIDEGDINWSISYLIDKTDGRVNKISVPDLQILGIDRNTLRDLEINFLNIDFKRSLDKQGAIIVAERYFYNKKYKLGIEYEVPQNPKNIGNDWIFELQPRQKDLENLEAKVTMIDGKVTLQNENHRLATANYQDLNTTDGVDREEALVILQYYYFAKNNWYTDWEEPMLPLDGGQFWHHQFKLLPDIESKDKKPLSVAIDKDTAEVLIRR